MIVRDARARHVAVFASLQNRRRQRLAVLDVDSVGGEGGGHVAEELIPERRRRREGGRTCHDVEEPILLEALDVVGLRVRGPVVPEPRTDPGDPRKIVAVGVAVLCVEGRVDGRRRGGRQRRGRIDETSVSDQRHGRGRVRGGDVSGLGTTAVGDGRRPGRVGGRDDRLSSEITAEGRYSGGEDVIVSHPVQRAAVQRPCLLGQP